MRYLFMLLGLIVATLTPFAGSAQVRATEPNDGTVLAQEGGIRLSFPRGWKPAGKEMVDGTSYYRYGKTFTGDDGPENIIVSVSVSKGGKIEKAVSATSQHYFPSGTHTVEMDEYTAPFKSALLTGITRTGTVFVKADAEDEGTPYIFYGLTDCNRNIVLAIPSVMPPQAEAELNFMLESVRCAE